MANHVARLPDSRSVSYTKKNNSINLARKYAWVFVRGHIRPFADICAKLRFPVLFHHSRGVFRPIDREENIYCMISGDIPREFVEFLLRKIINLAWRISHFDMLTIKARGIKPKKTDRGRVKIISLVL